AAKKAEEEKAAADKAAKEEAERKAAEEAAAREAEKKKGYNTGITFNDLARKPDDFKGKKVQFSGRVLQVNEVDTEIQIRLATKKNSWDQYYDDVIYIYFDRSLIPARILDDDIITIYGVSRGLYTYTTVLGASVTLPLIEVEKIDI
ncbi:MAG: toxin regulator, partial [Lachnospiraceae bacterium]|nr:toxin regulator [Lachnospiraceae bacterium]